MLYKQIWHSIIRVYWGMLLFIRMEKQLELRRLVACKNRDEVKEVERAFQGKGVEAVEEQSMLHVTCGWEGVAEACEGVLGGE